MVLMEFLRGEAAFEVDESAKDFYNLWLEIFGEESTSMASEESPWNRWRLWYLGSGLHGYRSIASLVSKKHYKFADVKDEVMEELAVYKPGNIVVHRGKVYRILDYDGFDVNIFDLLTETVRSRSLSDMHPLFS